jgi:hypothetical protein
LFFCVLLVEKRRCLQAEFAVVKTIQKVRLFSHHSALPRQCVYTALQALGKDAVRGKIITDAEKRRITIEVWRRAAVVVLTRSSSAILDVFLQVLRAKSSGLL